MKTRLINLDGMWGSGKTTQLLSLAHHLRQQGVSVQALTDENEQLTFYGEKPEIPTACGGGEWQSGGFGGGSPQGLFP